MLRGIQLGLVLLFMTVGTARGELWWTRYDAQTGLYPEETDWTRYASDPPAQRWFQDGKLFIDSRAAHGITDEYGQSRAGQMTLSPGQLFTFRFRIKVDYVDLFSDPGIDVESDDQHEVLFTLGETAIYSTYEPGKWAPFEPHAFHEFTVESSDFRSYRLYVDDHLGFEGTFFESLFNGAALFWGDMTSSSSLAEWDYVEAGVTPEPHALLAALAAVVVWGSSRR